MAINRSSTSSTQGSSTSTLGGRQPQRVSSYRLPHDVLRKYLQRTYPGQYKLETKLGFHIISAPDVLSQETLEALMEEE
ncbi:hypothetical protein LTR72_009943 [Exophiala xenobiotica]|nr:hypothetical protein LTR72_009943 [Exophiala xenobiotica]KAK5287610.1 hypothetical protein LTR14_008840 [Exophiala xenobiotica]KAK5475477.1 hypothetical protein LTR55_009105 [Exophiala xenobiotica]